MLAPARRCANVYPNLCAMPPFLPCCGTTRQQNDASRSFYSRCRIRSWIPVSRITSRLCFRDCSGFSIPLDLLSHVSRMRVTQPDAFAFSRPYVSRFHVLLHNTGAINQQSHPKHGKKIRRVCKLYQRGYGVSYLYSAWTRCSASMLLWPLRNLGVNG